MMTFWEDTMRYLYLPWWKTGIRCQKRSKQTYAILEAFKTLSEEKPEIAEQVPRMARTTLVNYQTSTEISRQLAKAGI